MAVSILYNFQNRDFPPPRQLFIYPICSTIGGPAALQTPPAYPRGFAPLDPPTCVARELILGGHNTCTTTCRYVTRHVS